MAKEIDVRHVGVEFLRPGPAHNQLLSPLTQYLAVCGESSAGVVTVPYEHRRFQRELSQLRYDTGDPKDQSSQLNDIGRDMGKVLGAVPDLPGSLKFDPQRPSTLVHLRITLSATELALLPFELAKVPVGPNAAGETWLGIQTRPPVCITRSIRSVSPEGVVWPVRPRVLFVSGDPQVVPYQQHFEALWKAVYPFLYSSSEEADHQARQQVKAGRPFTFGDLLTVLVNPTLNELLDECRRLPYTHVHFLMHGGSVESDDEAFGLVFRGDDDAPDVVSGERLADAIATLGRDTLHRPTVVTLASCDSGNVGSVIVPGASVAHALHQAGVPLVVGSQFPLSVDASTPLAERLYCGLLRGDHPLVLLQQLRAELHARYSKTWHDWASLVVYEALPAALDHDLDTLRYQQARMAIDASLQRLDLELHRNGGPRAGEEPVRRRAVDDAIALLPFEGRYSIECLGLRAAARKRLAQMAFTVARSGAPAPEDVDPVGLLEEAGRDYEQAYKQYLGSDETIVRRVATLHWVLVQQLSVSAVLGRPLAGGLWEAARLSAEVCVDHAGREERAWAHASLAELWMLRLLEPRLSPGGRRDCGQRAIGHAKALLELEPDLGPFTAASTCRQFDRYASWWGTEQFGKELADRARGERKRWSAASGLLDTARQIVQLLQPKERPAAGQRPARGTTTPAGKKPASTGAASGIVTQEQVAGAAPVLLTRSRTAARPATPAVSAPRTGPFFDVEMLSAEHGDSIWIEYGDGTRVSRWLMDCGTEPTAPELLRRVDGLAGPDRLLELLVMSHIDADHIGGVLPFFGAVRKGLTIGDVWFNGWRHISGVLGARQGEMFSTAIQDFKLPWNAWRGGRAIVIEPGPLPEWTLPGGMKLTLLSPSPAELKTLAPVWKRELKAAGLEPGARVDYSKFLKGTPSTSTNVKTLAAAPFSSDASAPNGSSIAVLAEYGGASALLAADAHPDVLAASIAALLRQRGAAKLKLDAFKVAHHASQNNLSVALMQLLDCPRYLVSTNGNHFNHPDREAIARIIQFGGTIPKLFFNYTSRFNEVWSRADLQEKYGYAAQYPATGQSGMRVELIGA